MFEQLLEALKIMGIFLHSPGFMLDQRTFTNSPDYINALIGFYSSFIAFWSKALKFSKQKRRVLIGRTLWSNYDVEFRALKTSMEKHKEALMECADAVHREQSNIDRAKNQAARKGRIYQTMKENSC